MAERTEVEELRTRLEDAEMRAALVPEREVIPAVAVCLSEESDWDPVVAWTGGTIVNHEIADSGEYESTLRLPDGTVAPTGSWLVLHQDGRWQVFGEYDAIRVRVPTVRRVPPEPDCFCGFRKGPHYVSDHK